MRGDSRALANRRAWVLSRASFSSALAAGSVPRSTGGKACAEEASEMQAGALMMWTCPDSSGRSLKCATAEGIDLFELRLTG